MIMSTEASLNAAEASTGEKQNAAFGGSSQLLGHCTASTELLPLSSDIQSLVCFFKKNTNCTISHNLYNRVSWTNPKITTVHKCHLDKSQVQLVGELQAELKGAVVCAARELHPRPSLRVSRAGLGAVQGPVYLSPYFVRSLLFSCRKVILGGGGRKCLMETGSPSDSCAEECGAGGTGQRSLCF